MVVAQGEDPDGVCVAQPTENIKQLDFSARVREVQSQKISVSNPTAVPWHLKPTISNDAWSGATALHIGIDLTPPPNNIASFSHKALDFLLCCFVCLGLHVCSVVADLGRHRARQV